MLNYRSSATRIEMVHYIRCIFYELKKTTTISIKVRHICLIYDIKVPHICLISCSLTSVSKLRGKFFLNYEDLYYRILEINKNFVLD